MPDGFLRQYLDGINLNLMDSDLILLNQLATLKNVSNRKAFSLSEQQLTMIHHKFKNMSDEREVWRNYQSSDHEQGSAQFAQPERKRSSPRDIGDSGIRSTVSASVASDIGQLYHREPRVQEKAAWKPSRELPRELRHAELEESREYRAQMPFNAFQQPSTPDDGADFTAVRAQKSTRKRSRARRERDSSRDSTPSRIPKLTESMNAKKNGSMIGKGSRYASPAGSRPDPNFGPRDMNNMINNLNTQSYMANATQHQKKAKNLLQDFLNVQPDKMQTLTGSKKETAQM